MLGLIFSNRDMCRTRQLGKIGQSTCIKGYQQLVILDKQTILVLTLQTHRPLFRVERVILSIVLVLVLSCESEFNG